MSIPVTFQESLFNFENEMYKKWKAFHKKEKNTIAAAVIIIIIIMVIVNQENKIQLF